MSWEERQQCQGSRVEAGMQDSDSICLHREGQEDARGGGLGACTQVTVEHPHYAVMAALSWRHGCQLEQALQGTQVKPLILQVWKLHYVLQVTQLVSLLRTPHEVQPALCSLPGERLTFHCRKGSGARMMSLCPIFPAPHGAWWQDTQRLQASHWASLAQGCWRIKQDEVHKACSTGPDIWDMHTNGSYYCCCSSLDYLMLITLQLPEKSFANLWDLLLG